MEPKDSYFVHAPSHCRLSSWRLDTLLRMADSDDERLADAKLRLRAVAAERLVTANNKASNDKRVCVENNDDDDDIFVQDEEAAALHVNKKKRLRRGGRQIIEESSSSDADVSRSDDDGSTSDPDVSSSDGHQRCDDEDGESSSDAASHDSSAESSYRKHAGEKGQDKVRQISMPVTANAAARAARWARSGVGEAKTAKEYDEDEARRLSKREKQHVRAPAPLLQEATAVGAVWTACAAQPRPAWSRSLQPAKAVEEEERRNHMSMAGVESKHGLSKHNTTARDEEAHLAASRAAAETVGDPKGRAHSLAAAQPGKATEPLVTAAGAAARSVEPTHRAGSARQACFPRAATTVLGSSERTVGNAAPGTGIRKAAWGATSGVGMRFDRQESDTSTPPPSAHSASAVAHRARSGKQPHPLGSADGGTTRPLLSSMMRSRLPQTSAVRCGGLLPSAVRMPSSLRESTGSAGLQALAKGNSWSFISSSRTASTSNSRVGSGARQVAAAAQGIFAPSSSKK